MPDSAAPSSRHRLAVEIEPGSTGHPELFAVAFGNERIVLSPAKSWIQLDHFKWVTRGIIEAPQSFAVHADGSVDYNGETVSYTHLDVYKRQGQNRNDPVAGRYQVRLHDAIQKSRAL